MKKLLLLFALMLSYQFVFGSTLVVKFPQGKFKVVLDGSVYWASHDLRFEQMYPGTKSITIIKETRNHYGQYAYRTVYDGLINVPRKSSVTAQYYRGSMSIRTNSLNGYGDPCGRCGHHHNGNSCNNSQYGNGDFYGNGCGNERIVCSGCGEYHNGGACPHQGNHNHHNDPCGNCGGHHNGGSCGIVQNNYHDPGPIFQLMEEESFDSDRLVLGLSYVKGHRSSAQEIRQMALLFTFDSSRLKFAKQAYAFCINPQDYYLVASTFTFSSNKRELLSYIG